MRRKGFEWLAKIVRSSKTTGPTGWCTACNTEVFADHNHPRACGRMHPDRVKQVPSLELTEEDCAIILNLIDTERDVPWRLVVKLYETTLDGVAGEESMRDDRDMEEKENIAWRDAFEKEAGETLGAWTPAEAMTVVRAGRRHTVVSATNGGAGGAAARHVLAVLAARHGQHGRCILCGKGPGESVTATGMCRSCSQSSEGIDLLLAVASDIAGHGLESSGVSPIDHARAEMARIARQLRVMSSDERALALRSLGFMLRDFCPEAADALDSQAR